METDDIYAFNSNHRMALSSMEVVDVEGSLNDGDPELSFEVEIPPQMMAPLIDEKRLYLKKSLDRGVEEDELVEAVAKDIDAALDIVFNAVGSKLAETGVYRKHSGNSKQWKSHNPAEEYAKYRDLLWGITDSEEDTVPSIPELYDPFLEAVVESEEHSLPPSAAVRPILSAHIDEVRMENNSRLAKRKLKAELEEQGISPREAANVASNMDDYLIPDAEIASTEGGTDG